MNGQRQFRRHDGDRADEDEDLVLTNLVKQSIRMHVLQDNIDGSRANAPYSHGSSISDQ